MIINNLGNPNNPKTETLSESIARDLRTTYFNPLWIKEMMNMGPGGPSRFIDVTNLLAWDLLNPGTVTSNQFQQIYDNYVKDSQNLGLNDYFQKYNPYTQQAIMYNLLQSIHSNRWNADAATKRDLANQFANSVIKNGWSGDPLDMEIVNEWLNSMDAKYVERVKSKLYASTMNSAFAPSNPQNPSNPQETNPQDGGSSSDGGSSLHRDKLPVVYLMLLRPVPVQVNPVQGAVDKRLMKFLKLVKAHLRIMKTMFMP